MEAKKANEVKEAKQQARNSAQGRKSNRSRVRGSTVERSRKGKGLVKKHLNLEKNLKESSSEDEKSVSSGTSELEHLPGVSPSKDDDAWCMFCDRKFSENFEGELWVMNIMCSLWAHVDCAGDEKALYICDFVAKQFNSTVDFLNCHITLIL
ncbi:hypothetical protein PR048_012576 [Dryococelus australis]|uniref:Zinc finger PHD-type domain-containing protein n=1 Tax=Dryococelus australis TaxID=614101 RepID=A0ABQ9HPS8_9NEOP|nr:hypothetical protein PR048_012576 [Dryococelus australis]